MGNGIAQTAAQAGFHTILYELNEAVLSKAKENIEKNLQLLAEKKKEQEEQQIKKFINQKRLFISAIGVAFIISFLAYGNYRNNIKNKNLFDREIDPSVKKGLKATG